jgi:hypothetical protein
MPKTYNGEMIASSTLVAGKTGLVACREIRFMSFILYKYELKVD